MEIMTSWMEQGMEQGQTQGMQHEALNYTLRLLRRKFGELEPEIETQVQALSVARLEELGEALLDFSTIADVVSWFEGSGE